MIPYIYIIKMSRPRSNSYYYMPYYDVLGEEIMISLDEEICESLKIENKPIFTPKRECGIEMGDFLYEVNLEAAEDILENYCKCDNKCICDISKIKPSDYYLGYIGFDMQSLDRWCKGKGIDMIYGSFDDDVNKVKYIRKVLEYYFKKHELSEQHPYKFDKNKPHAKLNFVHIDMKPTKERAYASWLRVHESKIKLK
jgi:hypothetical protein